MPGCSLETHHVPEVVGTLMYDNRPAGDLAPGYGITPRSRHAKNRYPRSIDPRHDAIDSRAISGAVNHRVDEQSTVFVVFARYPYLGLVVGLAVAQRRVGVSVGQELTRYRLRDCPRSPSSDAAEAVNNQGADAALCTVADAAPPRVVVQVDLSGVASVNLGYGMLRRSNPKRYLARPLRVDVPFLRVAVVV